MKFQKFCLFAFVFSLLFCSISIAEPKIWQKLDDGLYLGEFDSPQKSPICNYPITILKIDPKLYSFKLLSASEHDGKKRTTKQWCKKFGLIAAINASMYRGDKTSTGYMKNYKHLNNTAINPKFGAFMAFNPVNSSVPFVQIIDRYHQNWKNLITAYSTVIQNYRMVTLAGENAWKKKTKEKIYSTAAIGIDRSGNVLFILSRAPYSTHDFNDILLALPISLKNAMYVEGGPEATLYVKAGDKEQEWVGSYETYFNEYDDNNSAWHIPNVIGIAKRK